jgi:hypothetical protein
MIYWNFSKNFVDSLNFEPTEAEVGAAKRAWTI